MQRDAGRKGREKLRQGCHSNEAHEAARQTQNRLLTEVLSSLLLGLMEMKSILPASLGEINVYKPFSYQPAYGMRNHTIHVQIIPRHGFLRSRVDSRDYKTESWF